ncbi:hypothetical protein FBUS_08042 [Fasciolopsis buskii]|uniref:Uncharacterized protein n=1 Tax=Fasciolopsis buskii TaxID=27845 RepID=A0A8E0VGE8_9TREM|nr:hypothetical protein FBUS_08042 [Fasciolopsis buski]
MAPNQNGLLVPSRHPRSYRGGGRSDWSLRPSKSRPSNSTSNGWYASSWMHDDRSFYSTRQNGFAKTTGSRFGRRPFIDRKYDAQGETGYVVVLIMSISLIKLVIYKSCIL